ncbi:MAG: diguanylate cyclase [Solidesulfovibrio sp. DCME]|uniref:diguanylate cyclase n=1 Tax=Solidesulfovibrio sp. DCME TaxID=3447380 RepID=UPI003D133C44
MAWGVNPLAAFRLASAIRRDALAGIRDVDAHPATGGLVGDPHGQVRQRTQELSQANSKLRRLSASDGLTGLANRRMFDETFQGEWNRALRHRLPLAVLLLDVDQFKAYNDHYGHLAGDACLKRIAQALQGAAQGAGELVARYGGEEFVILLPGLLGREGAIADAGVVSRARRARKVLDVLPEARVEDSAHRPDGTVSSSGNADAARLRKGNRAYYGHKNQAATDCRATGLGQHALLALLAGCHKPC